MSLMTYQAIQDMAIKRFNENLRDDLKQWILATYQMIWNLDAWTFKKDFLATITVTQGSDRMTGLPADLGVPTLLQHPQGDKVAYLPPREFQLYYSGTDLDAAGCPRHWTDLGDAPSPDLRVGPVSSETSSSYQLLYDRACGYYPSTTLTATVTLPATTISVDDTATFPSAGDALVGGRKVSYTGKTSTTLTGCTGGTGSFASGDIVISLQAMAGDLAADTDVPLLPSSLILVHAAQAVGQSLENDVTAALNDDRVQTTLDSWRRRYLANEHGEAEQWGSYSGCDPDW